MSKTGSSVDLFDTMEVKREKVDESSDVLDRKIKREAEIITISDDDIPEVPVMHRPAWRQTKVDDYDTLDADASRFALSDQVGNARTTSKKRGVPVGTWKYSAGFLHQDKHVVFSFIDAAKRLYILAHGEKQDGTPIPCFNSMPRRISFEEVLLFDHLKSLSKTELARYTAIRELEKSDDETLQQRYDADLRTMLKVKSTVASEAEVRSNKSASTMAPGQTSQSKTVGISTPHHEHYNKVFLGHWRYSGVQSEMRKHAVYGYLREGNDFQLAVFNNTKDGQFMPNDQLKGPGPFIISFDECNLDKGLADFTPEQLEAYVRFRLSYTGLNNNPVPQLEEQKSERQAQTNVADGNVSPMVDTVSATASTPDPISTRMNSIQQTPMSGRRYSERLRDTEKKNYNLLPDIGISAVSYKSPPTTPSGRPKKRKITNAGEKKAAEESSPKSKLSSEKRLPGMVQQEVPEEIQFDGLTFKRRGNSGIGGDEYVTESKLLVSVNGQTYIDFRVLKKVDI